MNICRSNSSFENVNNWNINSWLSGSSKSFCCFIFTHLKNKFTQKNIWNVSLKKLVLPTLNKNFRLVIALIKDWIKLSSFEQLNSSTLKKIRKRHNFWLIPHWKFAHCLKMRRIEKPISIGYENLKNDSNVYKNQPNWTWFKSIKRLNNKSCKKCLTQNCLLSSMPLINWSTLPKVMENFSK